MSRFASLQASLQPCRQNLLRHPLYDQLADPGRLRQFLEHHVFAVWDFMSLLKVLQRELCGTQIPWTPPRSTAAARLINEIVTGEESDLHPAGGYASHFQLYREAMQQFGADTWGVDQLVQTLRQGTPLADALENPDIPAGARRFVKTTFALIGTGELPRIAGAFALGREILIPGMFRRIVQGLNQELGGGLSSLVYYLDRHIELDGGAHGTASEELLCELCGTDPEAWRQAQDGALMALEARLHFWDDIVAAFTVTPHQQLLVPSR